MKARACHSCNPKLSIALSIWLKTKGKGLPVAHRPLFTSGPYLLLPDTVPVTPAFCCSSGIMHIQSPTEPLLMPCLFQNTLPTAAGLPLISFKPALTSVKQIMTISKTIFPDPGLEPWPTARCQLVPSFFSPWHLVPSNTTIKVRLYHISHSDSPPG